MEGKIAKLAKEIVLKVYSLDFQQKIVDTYFKEPISQHQVAKRFGVALSFVENLLKQIVRRVICLQNLMAVNQNRNSMRSN